MKLMGKQRDMWKATHLRLDFYSFSMTFAPFFIASSIKHLISTTSSSSTCRATNPVSSMQGTRTLTRPHVGVATTIPDTFLLQGLVIKDS